MPRLTVITPNKNHRAGLMLAAESLRGQTFQDWEHLVIDSMSTDGSAEYAAGRAQTRFVSAPDRSLEEALNKGLRLAEGKYVTFLLGYDSLIDPTWLQTAVDALESDPSCSMISACTGAKVTDPPNYGYASYPQGAKFNSYFFIAPWPILNETAFVCPRSVLLEHFPDWREASRKQDIFFHLWINFLRAGRLCRFVPRAVVNCDMHPGSRLLEQMDSGEFRAKEHDFLDHKRLVKRALARGRERIVFRDQQGRPLPLKFSRFRFLLALFYYKLGVFWVKKVLRRRIKEMQYYYCQALCRKCVDLAM
jgi:glycosyltransferase involved in cell wall biosynthesis